MGGGLYSLHSGPIVWVCYTGVDPFIKLLTTESRYDTGIISAVLVYIGNDLGGRAPTHSEKELITSLCSAGAFFGAICAGMTADKVRKHSILERTEETKTTHSH